MANNKVSKGSKGSKGSTAVPPSKEKNMSVDQILDVLRSQSGDTITISAKRLEALCKEIKSLPCGCSFSCETSTTLTFSSSISILFFVI